MSSEPPRRRRRLSPVRILILFTIGAFIAGGLVGLIGGLAGGEDAPPAVLYAFTAVVLVVASWVSVVYWRRLDEAAREAHKFAWYWGGSTGLLISGLYLTVFSDRPGGAFLWPGMDPSPESWLYTGAITVITAQIIGYVIVWAGWWLWNSRR